ncbi:MAG: hypothetical protein JWR11_1431 [Mycobacterium sp.]|jgi:hypothetical protein|nr:hypothetical protein [Mycobacterium sp.]
MMKRAMGALITCAVAAMVSFLGLVAINVVLFLGLRSQIPQTPAHTPGA